MDAFLREDERRELRDYSRWVTETIGVRKNVLRKVELEDLLIKAGFDLVVVLPKPAPWFTVQVIAIRKV
jgi:hypothetical protein